MTHLQLRESPKLPKILQISVFPCLPDRESVVIFAPPHVPVGGVEQERDASRATKFLTSEVCMEQRASSSSTAAPGSQSSGTPREGRGVWVLTAYGISGLAMFGILFYYFSTYVTH
jgi:hypothetical protein